MQCKIGLIGARGKLGREIQALYPTFAIEKSRSLPIDCDVLIDVSSSDALEENLALNKPLVIGTTGHQSMELIEKAAETLPIFYAANFSIGAFLLHKLAKMMDIFPSSDVDLIEVHHKEKKDAPSGTALSLKKIVPKAHIHSLRSGNILGEHTLIFNNEEEKITLSHQVHSKKAFAVGAIRSALFLVNQKPGLYTMENLMENLYGTIYTQDSYHAYR